MTRPPRAVTIWSGRPGPGPLGAELTQTRHSANPSSHAAPPGTVTLRGADGPVVAQVGDVGTGCPVVFLHGLVGLNDHWEDVVRRVRGTCRCVMLELPLLQLEGDDCSIQGVEALTVQFLEKHVGEPAVLVGNSFGGHVALRLALHRPELVRGLVLAGSSGLIEKTMVKDVQIHPSREWLVEKIGELFFDRTKLKDADIDRAHRELTRREGARAMVRLSRSARRDHLGERIGEIKAPTLLVWGKQDVVTPPEAADIFKRTIRDSRLVWFDRCGHAPMVECPEEFSAALQTFVRELDAKASRA